MIIKKIIIFLLIFLLFYYESDEVAGIKFAILWKSIVLLFLIWSVTIRGGFRTMPKMVLWGSLFAVESAINMSIFVDSVSNISELMKNAYIPLFFSAFITEYSDSKNAKIVSATNDTAIFVILSSLPFISGLLEPRGVGYDFSLFEQSGGGFVGIFQTGHSAAITLSSALIVILDMFWSESIHSKRLMLILVSCVGVTALYLTFVRTGYFMFLLSAVMYLLASKLRYKFLITAFLIIGATAIGVYLFYISDVFRMRMLGINSFLVASGSTDVSIDSGRWQFWTTAVDYFTSQDIFTQIIGLGSYYSMELMYQYFGLRVYAHSGFVNVLQFNGYVGVFLYCLFLINLIKYVLTIKGSRNFSLIFALLVSYLSQMLVQGERVFLADLLFVGGLLAGYADYRNVDTGSSYNSYDEHISNKMVTSR